MSVLIALFCLVLCVFVAHRLMRLHSKLPLPPSPPADPFIGHLRTVWRLFHKSEALYEWSKTYGDVFSLRTLGKTIIVLNSQKAAFDLLEKRSAIYSDRPRFAFYDVLGWGDSIIFSAYGPFHTAQRKLYQNALGKNVVSEYGSMQEREANALIKNLLKQPEAFDRHVQLFAGGIVSDLGYGHRMKSVDDEVFRNGETFNKLTLEAIQSSLLDIHPLFRYWPTWAPASGFKKALIEIKPYADEIVFGHYKKVQEQMSAGVASLSFTSKGLESIYRGERDSDAHRALQLSAGMIFAAGYDTTYHTTVIFIACMLQHPEVQQKAQEEIDRVLGRQRLPDFSDIDSLPYVRCVMYETFRWKPVAPIGIPHRVMVDDEYNGMRIPKNAMIIANTKSINWDATQFREPHLFKPERFLPKPIGDGETFPVNGVFGWGRRICAGRHLAERSVWIAIVRILATLTITPARDAEGNTVEHELKTSNAFSIHIHPFPCDIRPRDEMARRLIQDAPID